MSTQTTQIITAINTIITSYLSKTYNMDNVMYSAITVITNFILTSLCTYDYGFLSVVAEQYKYHICSTLVLSLIVIGIVYYKEICFYLTKMCKFKHYTITLESNILVAVLEEYMKKYPEFYDVPEFIIISKQSTVVLPAYYIVHFDDKNLNLKGYLYKTNDQHYTIHIQFKPDFNPSEYISEIKKRVRDEVILYSVQKFYSLETIDSKECQSFNGITYVMYSGCPINDQIRESYLNRLFHPMKHKLWRQIQFVNNIKNNSQIGFILYGPAGTGKSRFAYSMAIATQRHLISFDLATYSKYTASIALKNPYINGISVLPSEVIYVFDEFDQTILALQEKEIQQKNKINTRTKLLEDIIETKNTTMLESLTPDGNSYKKQSNELKIGHLLELIQGPVPLKGAIFIATTNNFETINKICPQLCRVGRLTPIYFGYAEYETLQEISQEYYKSSLKIAKNSVATIATSEIINFINEHMLNPDYKFKEFEEFIKLRTKQIPSSED